MSLDVINRNPELLKAWLDREEAEEREYRASHPDSLIPAFEKELRDLGFVFQIHSQCTGFLPKHKQVILPIAVKYYQMARDAKIENEQNYFLGFFHFRGFKEVVPMLIEDYFSPSTQDLTRWCISDCLYQIKAPEYRDAYLSMISNKEFGSNRKMIILLVGQLKIEEAIPVLIELLEDEEVRLHAISALGYFKREEFRPYFERFAQCRHPGWRKYARQALKKLDG